MGYVRAAERADRPLSSERVMLRFFKTLSRLGTRIRRSEDRLRDLSASQAELRRAFDDHRLEMRLVMGALSLPDASQWRNLPPFVPGQPAVNAFPHSTVCRQESFREPYFSYWAARLGEGLRYHRKLWEFVFVSQALWERGAIRQGARGVGFGVGLEPLPAYFASEGCEILATDLSPEGAETAGWAQSSQHARGEEALRRPLVCPDELFDLNVRFQTCDMCDIPASLVDFDFCWSACALEHLGSIEKGLDFIVKSIDCLKPGGWAVHTTEFNLSSNTDTVDYMDTVLFRQRDFETLIARLKAAGHHVAMFDFDPGAEPLDVYIDLPPYRADPHLKAALLGYATTSIGMIIQRGPAI